MLKLMLKLADLIRDDELFCETENNIVYCYIDEKGLLNITEKEWDVLQARGLCCEDIARYHLETLALTQEKKEEMIRQLLEETKAARLNKNGGIAERLH